MHDTGCLGLVHWDDPEGWYGEGGGRRVEDGEKRKKKKEFYFPLEVKWNTSKVTILSLI